MTDNIQNVESEISPLNLLHRAGQFADVLFNAEIRDTDMTPRQYAVLACVESNENLSQADIVARTGIDRSTLADVVRRLSRQGLLDRTRTREDARRYAVKLTDLGRQKLGSARPAAASADHHILSTLCDEQRDCFLRALHKIVETLEGRQQAKAGGAV